MAGVSPPAAEPAPTEGGAASEPAAAARKGSVSQYPPGWYRVLDVSLQKYYYFHTGTKKTQWTRPEGLAEEPAIYGKPHRGKAAVAGGESKELGSAPAADAVEPKIAAGTAGASGDDADGSPPGSPGKPGSKNKLRSLVKGVANLLGLRRRGQERAELADEEAEDGTATSQPPSLPSAAGAASGTPAAAAAADTGASTGSGSAGASDAGAAGGGGGAESGGSAPGAGAVSAPGGPAGTAEDGTPPATPPFGRAKLTRRPSILKRGGSADKDKAEGAVEKPRGMGKRRISFADQRPDGALEKTYFADNLHYSPSADHSMAFEHRGGDDAKCVIS